MPDNNTDDFIQKAWHRRLQEVMDAIPEIRTEIKWIKGALERGDQTNRAQYASIAELERKVQEFKYECEQTIATVRNDAAQARVKLTNEAGQDRAAIKATIAEHLEKHKLVYTLVLAIPTFLAIAQAVVYFILGSGGE